MISCAYRIHRSAESPTVIESTIERCEMAKTGIPDERKLELAKLLDCHPEPADGLGLGPSSTVAPPPAWPNPGPNVRATLPI